MADNEGCSPGIGSSEGIALLDMVALLRSAETGNAECSYEFAERLWRGIGVAPDRAAAEKWYQNSAVDGHPSAQTMLGDIWRSGLNGRYSARLAVFWYKQAAAAGSADGQYRLACCYKDGEGVSRNQTRWVAMLQKAADSGSLKAMLALGDHYLSGSLLNRNWERSVHWYSRAAENGDVPSSFLIGQIFRHGGFGVTIDLEEAVFHFRLAADQGLWQAQVELARTLLFQNAYSEEAIYWLKRGLDYAGDEDVLEAVGKVQTGELTVVRWQSPQCPLRVSLEELHAEAALELTKREEIDLLGALGDHQAQLELAEILWREGNPIPAAQWLERSARGGLAESQYRMALMYQTGFPLARNREMQAYWCNLAAGQGHKSAKDMLASLFEKGDGVERSDARAQLWATCRPGVASGASIDSSDFSIEEIVDSKPGGTLYRRVRPGREPLVVIRIVAPGTGRNGIARVFWLRVPSHIDSVSLALTWALQKLRDSQEQPE